jgi:hypothetical protein
MADIAALTARAAAGDVEADNYFRTLFPASNCFLCDALTGERPTTIGMADPAAPGMALLAPVCPACAALTPAGRDTKALHIAKRMWPTRKWSIRDAAVVYGMVKWVMSELVRVFHAISPEEAAAVVDTLTDREVPLLWRFGDRTRVLGAVLSAKDKALALLYGSAGALPVREIVASIEYGNASQFRQKILKPAHKADLLHFDTESDMVILSPVGIRYVEENIPLTV